MRLSNQSLLVIILAAIPLNVGLIYIFARLNQQMGLYPIVDYEFAWTVAQAQTMFAAWGEIGLQAAVWSLWIDYGFMVAYSVGLAALALLVTRALPGGWQGIGLWLTLVPFPAALLDALENAMLLSVLPPAPVVDLSLKVAGVAAGIKFALIVLNMLYIVIGAVVVAWRRWRK